MKVIERAIFPFQERTFFSPIRDKIEYARVVVLGARQLIVNIDVGETEITSNMKLIVEKMSRLFFYKGSKYYSISFPFSSLIDGNEVIELTSYSGKKLDNKIISSIISILDSEQFKLNPSLIDFSIDPNENEFLGLMLLEEIFRFEPSYIRYDFDPENEQGKLHPLYHLDINYSQYSTYKLGLNKSITQDYFENLQNLKTDCSYLIE